MEKIKEFLETHTTGKNYGYGYGSGLGSGSGSDYSDGYGYGPGSGSGSDSGHGYGDGYSEGSGYGYDSGSGHGYSDGYGYGRGYGDGLHFGISKYNSMKVYIIDDIPTIITSVHNNTAKGYIVNDDLTLTKCYIAKGNNKFAHGDTLKKAVEDLQNKIFAEMDVEETIDMFIKEFSDTEKKYPAKDFYIWHNRLTGSCEAGRNHFVKENGIDLDKDMFTVKEFIEMTENSFGGKIVKQLKQKLETLEEI